MVPVGDYAHSEALAFQGRPQRYVHSGLHLRPCTPRPYVVKPYSTCWILGRPYHIKGEKCLQGRSSEPCSEYWVSR